MCNEQKDTTTMLLGRNVTIVTNTKNGQIAKYKYLKAYDMVMLTYKSKKRPETILL